MRLLITGGAGFVGSALVRFALARGHEVMNLDALTYAACPASLFDVVDRRTVPQIFIDGIGLGGADELSLLEERGRLDPILRGRDVAPGANDPCFACLSY